MEAPGDRFFVWFQELQGAQDSPIQMVSNQLHVVEIQELYLRFRGFLFGPEGHIDSFTQSHGSERPNTKNHNFSKINRTMTLTQYALKMKHISQV